MRLCRVLGTAVLIAGGAAAAISSATGHPDEEMVEIAVEITEINNNKANALGIKWYDTVKAGEVAVKSADRIPETLPEVPSLIASGEWSRFTALNAELKILQEKGAAQVLAKPKIVTKSGTAAKVIVGGEIPIVASGVGGGSIQWKEFGIKAEITPRVMPEGDIDLILATEVSRLDWANQINGNPVIMKREARSNVRLKSGQTITLAGLIENRKEEHVSGIPLLADIPVLGVFFSRKNIYEVKTNIVIFVTPKIVEQTHAR